MVEISSDRAKRGESVCQQYQEKEAIARALVEVVAAIIAIAIILSVGTYVLQSFNANGISMVINPITFLPLIVVAIIMLIVGLIVELVPKVSRSW